MYARIFSLAGWIACRRCAGSWYAHPPCICNDPAEAIERPMTHRTSNSSAGVFSYTHVPLEAGQLRFLYPAPRLQGARRLTGLGIVPWGSRSLFVGCLHPCACPSLYEGKQWLMPRTWDSGRYRLRYRSSVHLDTCGCAKDTVRRRGAPGRALCSNS